MWICSALLLMSSCVAMATRVMAFSLPKVENAHLRTLRMNLTAAMPLLATRTL